MTIYKYLFNTLALFLVLSQFWPTQILTSSDPSPTTQHSLGIPLKRKQSLSYTCSLCKKKLTSSYGLHTHMQRIHPKKRPFKCTLCPKTFATMAIFNDHTKKIHHKICHACQKEFTSTQLLKSHLHDEHPCPVCQRRFLLYTALKKHIQSHSKPVIKKHKCTQCAKNFATPSQLKAHTKTVHIKKCKACQKTFASINQLKSHIKLQHPCPICKQTFTQIGKLERHDCQKEKSKFPCSRCEKIFHYPSDLAAHQKKNHHITCYYCKQKFTTRELCIQHKKKKHLTCKKCSKVFTKRSILLSHIAAKHKETHSPTERNSESTNKEQDNFFNFCLETETTAPPSPKRVKVSRNYRPPQQQADASLSTSLTDPIQPLTEASSLMLGLLATAESPSELENHYLEPIDLFDEALLFSQPTP